MQITTGNNTLVSDEKLVKKYFIKQIWKVLGQRSLIHKRPLQLPSLIHFLFVGLKCIIFFSVWILCLYLFVQFVCCVCSCLLRLCNYLFVHLLIQFRHLQLPGLVHYMFWFLGPRGPLRTPSPVQSPVRCSSRAKNLNHLQSLINHPRIMPDPSYEILA